MITGEFRCYGFGGGFLSIPQPTPAPNFWEFSPLFFWTCLTPQKTYMLVKQSEHAGHVPAAMFVGLAKPLVGIGRCLLTDWAAIPACVSKEVG